MYVEFLELDDALVHERLRRDALALGGVGDLLPVLVGAGEEPITKRSSHV